MGAMPPTTNTPAAVSPPPPADGARATPAGREPCPAMPPTLAEVPEPPLGSPSMLPRPSFRCWAAELEAAPLTRTAPKLLVTVRPGGNVGISGT